MISLINVLLHLWEKSTHTVGEHLTLISKSLRVAFFFFFIQVGIVMQVTKLSRNHFKELETFVFFFTLFICQFFYSRYELSE